MMYGGLKKSASRLALVAAAGVLSTNAFAADLGGDCCADLEERVAELEATTARKGTRKQSLEVWGNINKAIMSWSDGTSRNTYLGLDNTNFASRVGFRGNAKVSPSVTAGYAFMFDIASGGRTATANQQRTTVGLINNTVNASALNDDQAVRVRDSNVWLESSTLGRATLGRLTSDGVQGTIDLAGIGLGAASASMGLVGGALKFATPGVPGTFAKTYNITNTTDNNGDYGERVNGIKYTSPTFAGITFSATAGGALQDNNTYAQDLNIANTTKAGPYYAGTLKYAGEFSGVRLAAAVGYEQTKNYYAMGNAVSAVALIDRPNSSNVGGSLSLMHVATGLFAQGHYNIYKRGHDDQTTDSAKQWIVQAGVSKNWFGLGNTSLYGEYQRTTNGFNTFAVGAGPVAANDADMVEKMWGLGVSQKVDAAAMELYAGYRNHQISSSTCTLAGGCQSIGVFVTGARISF